MSQEQQLAPRHRCCNPTAPQVYGYAARVTQVPELTGINTAPQDVLLREESLRGQYYEREAINLQVQGVILKSTYEA